jgi:hypothetical protein
VTVGCCSTPPNALLTLSASLASETDFRSGANEEDDTVVGVSGAEVVDVGAAVELLLEPVKEVIDRIENLLLLLAVVGVVAEELGIDELEDDEGRGGSAGVDAGDEEEDEVDAVTPATMEDEIL